MVTSMALKNMLPRFLLDNTEYLNLKKFIDEKLDLERSEGIRRWLLDESLEKTH